MSKPSKNTPVVLALGADPRGADFPRCHWMMTASDDRLARAATGVGLAGGPLQWWEQWEVDDASPAYDRDTNTLTASDGRVFLVFSDWSAREAGVQEVALRRADRLYVRAMNKSSAAFHYGIHGPRGGGQASRETQEGMYGEAAALFQQARESYDVAGSAEGVARCERGLKEVG